MKIESIPINEPVAVKISFYYNDEYIDGFNLEFIMSIGHIPNDKEHGDRIAEFINDKIYNQCCAISDKFPEYIIERIDYTVKIARIFASLLDWHIYDPLTKTVTKTYWFWKK